MRDADFFEPLGKTVPFALNFGSPLLRVRFFLLRIRKNRPLTPFF
jgi:hypothetical protein